MVPGLETPAGLLGDLVGPDLGQVRPEAFRVPRVPAGLISPCVCPQCGRWGRA